MMDIKINCKVFVLLLYLKVIFFMFCVIGILIVVVGNIFICVVVYKKGVLRIFFNYFFVSLFLVSFMYVLVLISYVIFFMMNECDLIVKFLCKWILYVDIVLFCVVMFYFFVIFLD